MLDLTDIVLEHGKAIDAQTEGPSRIALGIDASVAQHVRVHHAAPHQLDPAALLAGPATPAFTKRTARSHLTARLRKRKEAGLEARPSPLSEKLLGKEVERALEVGKGHVGVDGQPFELVKHGRVRRIRILIAIALAGRDDVEW